MKSKQLREKRAKLVKDAQALLPADGAEMSVEARGQFDALMADADRLKESIDRIERAEVAAAEMDEVSEVRSGRQLATHAAAAADREGLRAKYREAFLDYCRNGNEGMAPENRAILRHGFRNQPKDNAFATEQRAQTVTTTGGGYLIPEGFSMELDKALLAFGGMRKLCRVLRTPSGQSLPWPTVDDTSNKATLTSINTQTTATDLVFGTASLDAYSFKSLVLVPFELLQDSAFNLDSYVRDALAERVFRGTNTYFTTGTGSSQPNGIVTAATAGVTAAASNSISHDDLVDLEHSVDPLYRVGPNAGYMLSDNAIKIIKKLKDSDGRPLWASGIAVGEPDTINGYKYVVNQDMASVEASAKSVLFGDMSKFIVRDVSEMIMLRLTERYADYGQVGFLVFSRHDSELIDAGTNPVKYLIHPSP